MKKNILMLSVMIAFTALVCATAKAQDTTMSKHKNKMHPGSKPMQRDSMRMEKDERAMNNSGREKDTMEMDMPIERDKKGMKQMGMNHDKMEIGNMKMPDLKSWPEASQMAVKEISDKYGKADVMGADVMMWMNKGPWNVICITKQESKHSFPVEHTDMMMQCISYKVPADKYDDLAKFDGSVVVDRTQGLISARCDKEANNMLALNLANDIVTGKKTVAQARKAYGSIVKQKMNGGNPLYMQKLTFKEQNNAADADINTTGLTKADVMNGGKANMRKVAVVQ